MNLDLTERLKRAQAVDIKLREKVEQFLSKIPEEIRLQLNTEVRAMKNFTGYEGLIFSWGINISKGQWSTTSYYLAYYPEPEKLKHYHEQWREANQNITVLRPIYEIQDEPFIPTNSQHYFYLQIRKRLREEANKR